MDKNNETDSLVGDIPTSHDIHDDSDDVAKVTSIDLKINGNDVTSDEQADVTSNGTDTANDEYVKSEDHSINGHVGDDDVIDDIDDVAPDGGYGWIVVAASFVATTVVGGSVAAFSILYIEWTEYFAADKGVTGWIGSLNAASGNLLGKKLSFCNYWIDILLVDNVLNLNCWELYDCCHPQIVYIEHIH